MNINVGVLKKVALYAFYIALSIVILITVLGMNDFSQIIPQLAQANPLYILAAVGCVIGYLLVYPISLCVITHARNCKIHPAATYSIAMTEHFFNSITPMSTGGQPFQVYCFTRARVKAAESTCILLMNFMVFMLVTNGYALCSLFFCPQFIFPEGYDPNFHILGIAIFGFTCNFSVLLITFLVATNKHVCSWICKLLDLICSICKPLDRFCNKLFNSVPFVKRIVKRIRPNADACMPFYKRVSPKVEDLKLYFAQVQEAFGNLMKRKKHFILALVSKVVAMGLLYLATYFILWSLGLEIPSHDMFFIVCGTSFVITMVVFIPTPGASGGIEPAFKDVFHSIIEKMGEDSGAIAAAAMLIWRLLTYYLVMGISFLFYIALEIYFNVTAKRRKAMGIIEEGEEDITPAILAVSAKPKKAKRTKAAAEAAADSAPSKSGADIIRPTATTPSTEVSADE
jgi:uncharacterized membrane protein YbhN (UPF0104 family)